MDVLSCVKISCPHPVLSFYFPPIHTQTITNMNSKQNKAKERQDIQYYAFINMESRHLFIQFKANFAQLLFNS